MLATNRQYQLIKKDNSGKPDGGCVEGRKVRPNQCQDRSCKLPFTQRQAASDQEAFDTFRLLLSLLKSSDAHSFVAAVSVKLASRLSAQEALDTRRDKHDKQSG